MRFDFFRSVCFVVEFCLNSANYNRYNIKSSINSKSQHLLYPIRHQRLRLPVALHSTRITRNNTSPQHYLFCIVNSAYRLNLLPFSATPILTSIRMTPKNPVYIYLKNICTLSLPEVCPQDTSDDMVIT